MQVPSTLHVRRKYGRIGQLGAIGGGREKTEACVTASAVSHLGLFWEEGHCDTSD